MKLKNKILTIIFVILMLFQTVSYASSPTINSKAAILVEVSTGRILYEKNSTKQLYPASTTKIMTAIVVLENVNNMQETAIISNKAAGVGGSRLRTTYRR